nr:SPASM domain-containing protein [Desulfobacterales bacterium]
MRVSRYNIFIEQDSYVLGFNALTGAFARIDRDMYAKYHQISDKELDVNDPEVEAFIEDLKKGGFIIEDNFDELDYLKVRHFASRFGSRHLSLTVAPTLDCNFGCPYCYEPDKRAEYMTREVEDKLVDYITQRLENISTLSVSWFGGEPTLALDTMCRLSEKFRKKAAENEVKYSEEIITNGYNLTKEVALRIKNLGDNISGAQVTVDGPPEIHDVRRPLTNGGRTFDVIMNNLQDIAGNILPVVLRVNLDEKNFFAFPKLLEILKQRGLAKRLHVYVAQTDVGAGSCQSASDYGVDVPQFAKLETEAQRILLDKGFVMYTTIKPNFVSCLAVCANRVVITPKGDIHRCWRGIDNPRERSGNLFEPATINKNETKWLAWNPFERTKCRNCYVLPLCMGGCPYKSVEIEGQPAVAESDRCYSVKYNVRELLKSQYRQYQMQKMATSKEGRIEVR